LAPAGKGPPAHDLITHCMGVETKIDGVAARVIELTGEPGDMVFRHPAIVHCVAPNHGSQPRFKHIRRRLMTHEARRLRSRRTNAG
jgi:hypothetical protein